MTDPTPPPAPSRSKAELAQLRADAAANESLVRHHADYRTWVEHWLLDAADASQHRAQVERHAVRTNALGAAMAWLRDTHRTAGLRLRDDGPPADMAELIEVAERFEVWITEGRRP